MPSVVAQECSGWFGWWYLPSWQAQHEIFVKRVDRGASMILSPALIRLLQEAVIDADECPQQHAFRPRRLVLREGLLTAKDGNVMHSDSANSARFLNSRWTGWPKIHQRQIFCWKDWKGHFQPFQFHGCRVRHLISCIIRLYLLVNSWKNSGQAIFENCLMPQTRTEVWTCWNILIFYDFSWFSKIFYDFLEMMRWYMNLIPVPLASEGEEAPELFESEFWVATVSVSRNGILIQCLIAMLFSLVELFGSCNLQGEQHPLVLVCFDGFRLVWWFQNIRWIDKPVWEKNHQRPTGKTFACSSLARLKLDGGGWYWDYWASLLFLQSIVIKCLPTTMCRASRAASVRFLRR